MLLCCASLASPVAAQDASALEQAAAETLFNEALQLLDAGEAAQACPKLEESQRLDPGVGTLLYLADCYRQTGRTASAWATFREAAYSAKENGDERQAVAEELAEGLKPKLSYLQIQLQASDDLQVEVKQDGRTLGAALLGTPLPVDPGPHELSASAPGYAPWQQVVTIATDPGTLEVTIPVLRKLPPSPEPAPEPRPAPPPAAPAARGADLEARDTQSRLLPYSLLGVGAVGLIGGGVFAALAKSSNASADAYCIPDSPDQCNGDGVSLGEKATTQAQIAAVGAGTGLLAVAAGVTLLLMGSDAPAPDAPPVAASVGPGGATLSWTGRW